MLRAVPMFALLLFRTAAVAQEVPAPSATDSRLALPTTAPAPGPGSGPLAPPAGAAKIVYSQCHVEGPYIAMTFDDGPHAQNTPRLLEMLKKRNIKATFFLVGQCVIENRDIAKRIVAEGHEIANHSWSHPTLSRMSEESVLSELQRTHDAIVEATGITPTLMRPPYGAFTPGQRTWANKKWGYKIILWDVDPLDWKFRHSERVHTEILKQTVSGSIVLSHDIHKSTIDAMPETLDDLANKGFKFVTVSELIAMDRPVPPRPKVIRGRIPSETQPAVPPGISTPPSSPSSAPSQADAPSPPAGPQRK